MMKKSYALFLFLVMLGSKAIAQNVGINATGAVPDGSAMLDIAATDKGLLIPRIALSSTISSAPIGAGIANSLLVYNTATAGTAPNNVTPGYYYWNGTRWVRLLDNTGNNGTAWLTTGNAGTSASTNFLGTIDNVDLVFRTWNTEKMRIRSNGNVGIGTATPAQKLHVVGGARITSLAANALVRSYPNGDLSTINFSGSTNDVLLGNGTFGNITSTGAVTGTGVATRVAFWNSNNSLSSDANLYWDNTNKRLGIGTAAPAEKLDIVGNVRLKNFDAVYKSLNNYGNNFHLIGTYSGWDNEAIYIAGYNYYNPSGGNPNNSYAKRLHIGRSERMTVDFNSGNVGIGTTAPITKLHVAGTHPGAGFGNGSNSDAPSQAIIPAGSDGTSRYNDWPNGWGGGVSIWDIVGSSTYFSGYLSRSDKKFKQNIHSLSETKNDVINKFMQLRPVSYFINPKTLPIDDPERKRFGFIANEIETIFPNLVINAGLPDSIARGLEYDGFIPILVMMTQEHQSQIKEQQKIIDELNTKNQDLVKSIKELKAELDKLNTVNEQLTTQNTELKSRIERIEQMLGTTAAKSK